MALAKVETVVRDVVSGVDRGRLVVYTPRKWALIMTIIRLLPRKTFWRTNLLDPAHMSPRSRRPVSTAGGGAGAVQVLARRSRSATSA